MTDLILGYGKSGKAAHAFLLEKKRSVIVYDDKEPIDIDWNFVERVVISPGIAPSHPALKDAMRRNKEILGEMELGAQFVKNICVGVTGTNGKTTVTMMIAHMLNFAGKKATALGNIGKPLTEYLLQAGEGEVLVLEFSSFQLETMKKKFLDRALFLNVTPDHLDRYENFEQYCFAKSHIANLLKEKGLFFLFERDLEFFKEGAGQRNIESFVDSRYKRHGDNVRAAVSICKSFGVDEEICIDSLKSFRGPPHRLEKVRDVRGVSLYNDSKATNKDSVRFALEHLPFERIHLLAGGIDKGGFWKDVLSKKVKSIFAFGDSREQIEKELSSVFKVKKVKSLKEALNEAFRAARKGDCILLSPGCSSFDQFDHFEHRGDSFKRMVEELK